MLDDFPDEEEPDCEVSLPHHFWIGIIVVGFAFGTSGRHSHGSSPR